MAAEPLGLHGGPHPPDIQADIEIALAQMQRAMGDTLDVFSPETIARIAIDLFVVARKDRLSDG